MIKINNKEVNISSLKVEGIDMGDFPDFCDAFITYAEFVDGTKLNDKEMDKLDDEQYGLANEIIHDNQLYIF